MNGLPDWRALHATLVKLGHERTYALVESWGAKAMEVFGEIRPHESRLHAAFKAWGDWRRSPSEETRRLALVMAGWVVITEDWISDKDELAAAPARSIRDGVRHLLFGTADPTLLWEALALLDFVEGMTSVRGPSVGQEFSRDMETALAQVPT